MSKLFEAALAAVTIFMAAMAAMAALPTEKKASATDLSSAVLVFHDEKTGDCIGGVKKTEQSKVTLMDCQAAAGHVKIIGYKPAGTDFNDLAEEFLEDDPWKTEL